MTYRILVDEHPQLPTGPPLKGPPKQGPTRCAQLGSVGPTERREGGRQGRELVRRARRAGEASFKAGVVAGSLGRLWEGYPKMGYQWVIVV